jgi:glycerol uptake facilitator-like aquaporin
VDEHAPKVGGLAIGLTIAADILALGPLTGASMNPARSFGPALASWTWNDFWIWIVGPIAGATLGGFAYQLVRAPLQTEQS